MDDPVLDCQLVGQETVWQDSLRLLRTPCHLFLTGPPGSGKTQLARSILQYYAREKQRPMASQWGIKTTDDCLLLGPDHDRGIQTIRGQVSLFIRQMSLGPNLHRWVLVEDTDSFPHISQQALRRPMETYSHVTRFLFIGSSEEDLIPALRSRCIHLCMQPIDLLTQMPAFLQFTAFPADTMTAETWSWITAVSGTNTSDVVRLLRLIRDVHEQSGQEITISLVRTLCSMPSYTLLLPLLHGITRRDLLATSKQLLLLWKTGLTYEDILESLQTIQQLFGHGPLSNHVLVHQFLIRAWTNYCKGQTGVLALLNVAYVTLKEPVLTATALTATSSTGV